jgi:hypothetical protein
MKYGEGKTEDIKETQQILLSVGSYGAINTIDAKGIVDGIWGIKMLEALIRFQLAFAGFSWDELFNPSSDEYFGIGDGTLQALKKVQSALSPVRLGTLMLYQIYFQMIVCMDEHISNPLNFVAVSGNSVKRNDSVNAINGALAYTENWDTQSTSSKKAHIWTYMTQHGYSKELTAAFMGNMQQESNFSPTNAQNNKYPGEHNPEYLPKYKPTTYSATNNGDGVGWGLLQFTFYSIKYDLYEYALSHKGSVADMDIQLDFIEYTLNKESPSAWRKLQEPSNAEASELVKSFTKIIFSDYERAGDSTLSARQGYAVKIYDEYAK